MFTRLLLVPVMLFGSLIGGNEPGESCRVRAAYERQIESAAIELTQLVDAPVDPLPPAVRSAVDDSYPWADVVRTEIDLLNPRPVYWLTLRDGERTVRMEIVCDGEVLTIEKPTTLKNVRMAAIRALCARSGVMRIDSIVSVITVFGDERSVGLYRFEVVGEDGSSQIVRIEPDGNVLS